MENQNQPRLRVAIFHRDELFRRTLTALLAEGGLDIVRTAAEPGGGDAEDPNLDLALFGSSFLRGDLAVLKRWCASPVRVVVLTDAFSLADFRTAVRVGTDGYLSSDIEAGALTLSLRLAMAGEFAFPSAFADLLLEEAKEAEEAGPSPAAAPGVGVLGFSGLNQRDLLLLRLVVQGRSNKEIARTLCATEDVVKMRLSAIMRLVHARNRIQAAVWAVQYGLIEANGVERPEAGAGPDPEAEPIMMKGVGRVP